MKLLIVFVFGFGSLGVVELRHEGFPGVSCLPYIYLTPGLLSLAHCTFGEMLDQDQTTQEMKFDLESILKEQQGLQDSSCQDGWIAGGGKCYFYSHDSVPWVDAVILCKDIGGQLAELRDVVQGLRVENRVKLLNTNFYIGAHDILVPGNWQWINSGNTLYVTGYSNWAPGMPSNATDSNCIYLQGKDGSWANGHCSVSMNFICESAYMY